MTYLWLMTAASLVVALVAWASARRTARRLDRVTEMCWELKYQYSEMRARTRDGAGVSVPSAGAEASKQPEPDNFVSLASLKR